MWGEHLLVALVPWVVWGWCSVSAPGGGHRTGRGLAVPSAGDLLEGQSASSILDVQLSGLVLSKQHAALGGSMVPALPLELQQAAFIAHHPVQADHALLFQMKDMVQLAHRRTLAMEVRLRSCWPCETPVVLGHVLVFDEAVGFFIVRDPGQPQLLHQPVLMRAVRPLHAALRLRAVGRDDANTSFAHIRPNWLIGCSPRSFCASVGVQTYTFFQSV